jgi:hypothetical protein
MEYTIELTNIGRGKVCKTFNSKTADLTVAENLAYKEATKYLMSRYTWLEHDTEDLYSLYAGGRRVGDIKIRLCESALN